MLPPLIVRPGFEVSLLNVLETNGHALYVRPRDSSTYLTQLCAPVHPSSSVADARCLNILSLYGNESGSWDLPSALAGSWARVRRRNNA